MKLEPQPGDTQIVFEEGKYTIIQHEEKPGVWVELYAVLRNDELWPVVNHELVGNKFHHHIFDKLFADHKALEAIRQAYTIAINEQLILGGPSDSRILNDTLNRLREALNRVTDSDGNPL